MGHRHSDLWRPAVSGRLRTRRRPPCVDPVHRALCNGGRGLAASGAADLPAATKPAASTAGLRVLGLLNGLLEQWRKRQRAVRLCGSPGRRRRLLLRRQLGQRSLPASVKLGLGARGRLSRLYSDLPAVTASRPSSIAFPAALA